MIRAALAVAALLAGGPAAAADCASDIAGLRRLAGDARWPMHWTEIGMDDGKPLSLVLRDAGGALGMRFDKAREGLWAEGTGSVCLAEDVLEMRFAPGELRAGPAAHWLLRHALKRGGKFSFARSRSGELKVTAKGWSGRFVPEAEPNDAGVTRVRDRHESATKLP